MAMSLTALLKLTSALSTLLFPDHLSPRVLSKMATPVTAPTLSAPFKINLQC